jgi:hypothetical protein
MGVPFRKGEIGKAPRPESGVDLRVKSAALGRDGAGVDVWAVAIVLVKEEWRAGEDCGRAMCPRLGLDSGSCRRASCLGRRFDKG